MYVCICRAVTTHTIKDLVADGARCTKEIGERCSAGTVCFKCRPTIRRLISQYHESTRDRSEDSPESST